MPRSPPAADSYQQGCIRMILENSDLWQSFHSIGTEMIITKHGRWHSLVGYWFKIVYTYQLSAAFWKYQHCFVLSPKPTRKCLHAKFTAHTACIFFVKGYDWIILQRHVNQLCVSLFQENVSTLQCQSIWAPTFCQLCHHDGHGSCRQLQIQGMVICNTDICRSLVFSVFYILFGWWQKKLD